MAAPDAGVASAPHSNVRADSCVATYRRQRQYHTIQCSDRVKLDLRVEEGLEGGGDVIRVVVPIVSFAVAVAVIVRMVVMGHDGYIDGI